jgi:electron transfer flavoprotein alpha subunit
VPETGFDAARITAAQRRPPEDDVLSRAEVVVSCGRGIKNKAGLSLATELANALGGVVGGSRGAVEDGLIPRNAQVGQTGRTVRPRLYIACGISGAAQHIAGMRQAGCVIAINTDPDAPVFKEADFGICADVFEALPKLIDMAINNTITRGGIK